MTAMIEGVPTRMRHPGPIKRGTVPRARDYLMCPPTHFTVRYSINPWMDPRVPVDTSLAMRQWDRLRRTYVALGHSVQLIEPEPGLPDMVFAANGGTVIGGKALGARFRHPERAAEASAYVSWFRENRFDVREALVINEGEGDLVCAGRAVIAGHGFRSDIAARTELDELFGLPVMSVRLVDPRFYHLDTALCVIDSDTAAYYPGAFDDAGRAALARYFRDLIEVTEQEAALLALNGVSDGHHVVLVAGAPLLTAELASRGFEPVPVEMSEFRKAGGGPKCCTLELRA